MKMMRRQADRGRPVRPNHSIGLGILLTLFAVGCERTSTPQSPAAPAKLSGIQRRDDFLKAKQRARAWFDRLDVDPVLLLKKGVKGKKKLAEILEVYLTYLKHAEDGPEKDGILRRAKVLAQQTERPEYHDMSRVTDAEFTQNGMSYLRVAWLMQQLGLDTQAYTQEIMKIKPRLDSHLLQRGPWQRAMFAEYYDRFGLQKPAALLDSPLQEGIIGRRQETSRLDDASAYDFTHEIFVAFDYGSKRTQDRFGADDLSYVRDTARQLILRYIRTNDPDLVGELLSGMTYLGWQEDAEYAQACDFLLDGQNANGSWGDYEAHRAQFGPYLEQHAYLHTTLVVIRSLMEAFEGGWEPDGPRGP